MRRPIDFDEEEFRESWQDWGRRLGRLGGWTGWLIILVILGLWFASGFFTVGPSEVGLVKRFGAFTRMVGPGFNYRLPSPIESVVIVDQRSVRTEEIGFRSRPGVPSTQFPVRTEEALMLTGDFNIIHVETVVQYDITDPVVFAFQVKDYRTILREAAQAVIREQIAFHTVDEALTEKREQIADKVLQELQALLDRYETGIRIINVRLQEVRPPTPEVAAAFDDVNSAVQDKERTIFEAQRYANEQLPRAEGQKQKILNQAEGYKQSRILQAQGDSARFISVLESYYLGETVTAARLYIETMEEILPNVNKIILPASSSGLISLLDLERLLQGQRGGEGR
jgi:membrane protease subunit HflK